MKICNIFLVCLARTCKIFEPLGFTNRIQQLSLQNSDPLQSKMTPPKLSRSTWTAPPLLLLDPVFLIRINYHFVLYILVS